MTHSDLSGIYVTHFVEHRRRCHASLGLPVWHFVLTLLMSDIFLLSDSGRVRRHIFVFPCVRNLLRCPVLPIQLKGQALFVLPCSSLLIQVRRFSLVHTTSVYLSKSRIGRIP